MRKKKKKFIYRDLQEKKKKRLQEKNFETRISPELHHYWGEKILMHTCILFNEKVCKRI